MEKFRNGFGKVVNAISYISMLACFVSVFVVAIDIILRKISSVTALTMSITGSSEISTMLLIVMVAFAIPAFQVKKGHIWVSMLVDKFPKRFQSFWLGGVHVIETVIVGGFVYGGYQKVVTLLKNHATTDILKLPHWIFALCLLVGFIELFVLLLMDSIQLFADGTRKQ